VEKKKNEIAAHKGSCRGSVVGKILKKGSENFEVKKKPPYQMSQIGSSVPEKRRLFVGQGELKSKSSEEKKQHEGGGRRI